MWDEELMSYCIIILFSSFMLYYYIFELILVEAECSFPSWLWAQSWEITLANVSQIAISSLICACVVRLAFLPSVIIMRRTCLISLLLTWGWQKCRGDLDPTCCLEPSPGKRKLEQLTSRSPTDIWTRIHDFCLSHWVLGGLFHKTIGNRWLIQWPVKTLYY